MSTEEQHSNFDSLFILAEENQNLSERQQCHTTLQDNHNQTTHATNRLASLHLAGPKQGGRGSITLTGRSRSGSGHGSRGSPARKPTKTTLFPSNPVILGSAAARSHSMRDQTSHMKEKYQGAGNRNNSLTTSEIEVTRQFLATNKKVINKGDSIKRRERPVVKKPNLEINIDKREDVNEKVDEHPKKIYRIVFLGSEEVGKTSIIDQFMSSEHADVYEDMCEDKNVENYAVTERVLTVDVNNILTKLSLVEANADINISEMVEKNNPDCYVLVYAVDDIESFESISSILSWLSENNYLSGKSAILVGNKADLERTRVVDTGDGCDLAVQFGHKFTETSPGMGHHIDELLVGIVMQLRLHESSQPINTEQLIKQTFKSFLNIFTGKEDEKRKSCRNLNM